MEEITIYLEQNKLPAHILLLTEQCQEIAKSITNRDLNRIPQFEPADGYIAWHLLSTVVREHKIPKNAMFCEWGSGIGHVTLMASALNLQATGIEIEPELSSIAQDLSRETGLTASFIVSSMFSIDTLPINYQNVDLFFVYPWPSQEQSAIDLFKEVAQKGAILIFYMGGLKYRILSQC